MDPSTIVKEVEVPKVIPIKTTLSQKMYIASKRAAEQKAKTKTVQDIQWDSARSRRRY